MRLCAKLIDRELLRIDGEEAEEFLQNIVTCDVKQNRTFGAMLTPQGKILFEFYLIKDKDGYIVDIAKELKDEFVTQMGLYKLRAKVEIKEEKEKNVFVMWGDAEINDARVPELGTRIYENEIEENAEAEQWHEWRTELGVPELGKDYKSGELYPHFVWMDKFKNGGVAFDKGCYVGQEVVSRMEHRGNVKQRFMIIENEKGELPKLGEEIKNVEGKKIGVMGGGNDNLGLALIYVDRIKENIGGIKLKLPDYIGNRNDTG